MQNIPMKGVLGDVICEPSPNLCLLGAMCKQDHIFARNDYV